MDAPQNRIVGVYGMHVRCGSSHPLPGMRQQIAQGRIVSRNGIAESMQIRARFLTPATHAETVEARAAAEESAVPARRIVSGDCS